MAEKEEQEEKYLRELRLFLEEVQRELASADAATRPGSPER